MLEAAPPEVSTSVSENTAASLVTLASSQARVLSSLYFHTLRSLLPLESATRPSLASVSTSTRTASVSGKSASSNIWKGYIIIITISKTHDINT